MSLKEEPPPGRVARKKEETKQKIVTCALKLFKLNGYNATSMEQIAAEADIAKGTLYNYFPVKEAILSEYIKKSFSQKNLDRLEQLKSLPDTRTRMITIIGELIEGVRTQKDIFEKYLTYRVQNIISLQKKESERSGIELLAQEIILLGQKSGEIRRDLSLGILMDFFEFIFIEVAKQFYFNPEEFRPRDIIESCVDLFINAVKPITKKKH